MPTSGKSLNVWFDTRITSHKSTPLSRKHTMEYDEVTGELKTVGAYVPTDGDYDSDPDNSDSVRTPTHPNPFRRVGPRVELSVFVLNPFFWFAMCF